MSQLKLTLALFREVNNLSTALHKKPPYGNENVAKIGVPHGRRCDFGVIFGNFFRDFFIEKSQILPLSTQIFSRFLLFLSFHPDSTLACSKFLNFLRFVEPSHGCFGAVC